jgi:lysophospholipase L1-like esterase
MRDVERAFGPAAAGTVRTVFVGDSFVEFQPLRKSLPAAVEERLLQGAKKPVEAVNLGISGSGVPSYYYRLRDVALPLAPDQVSVFFFSGNDFLFGNTGFSSAWVPPLVDESPGRSIVGRLMPHTNWLLVNRLRLSEFLSSNEPIPGEFEALQQIVKEPKAEALAKLAQHMKRHYFPGVPEQRLLEILSRGDGRLIDLFAARQDDREYLAGWLPNLILRAELNPNAFNSITTLEQAKASVQKDGIDSTLSWLVAMNRAARGRGRPRLRRLLGAVAALLFLVSALRRHARAARRGAAGHGCAVRRSADGPRGQARYISQVRCSLVGVWPESGGRPDRPAAQVDPEGETRLSRPVARPRRGVLNHDREHLDRPRPGTGPRHRPHGGRPASHRRCLPQGRPNDRPGADHGRSARGPCQPGEGRARSR